MSLGYYTEIASADFKVRKMAAVMWDQNYLAYRDADRGQLLNAYAYLHYSSMYVWYEADPTKPIHLPALVLDFDNPLLEFALDDLRAALAILELNYEVDIESLGIYFSGKKGFHLVIPSDIFFPEWRKEPASPNALKSFVSSVFGSIKSVDRIYDARRLIRIPGSVHHISSYYKAQFDWVEVSGATAYELAERSKEKNDRTLFEVEEPTYNKKLAGAFIAAQSLQHTAPVRRHRALFHELFHPAKVGERNERAVKLVGLLINRKVDLDLAQAFMATWNRTNEEPLNDRELAQIVLKSYNNYS